MRAMDLDISNLPECIGGYRRLRRIGRGGMGEVWLATKPGLAKPCALKIVLPEHSRHPEYRRRFLREAKILSTLRHGRIVTVLDVGEADGFLFIAMDYIDGVNLKALCEALSTQGRRLPVLVVAYVIGEVFEALRHAHTRTIGGVLHGVIHRDVTPDNVMISSEGEVFLSDFGIARFGADGSAELFGKFQYMAPEQGLGTATYRSDVWSACGVLHYMLTGEPPRLAFDWAEFRAKLLPPIRPTGRNDVPEPLERLRVSGLEPDPTKRLASAKDALLLLESWIGYRKATTSLAEIYMHIIGPARSGMTDMMPVAPVQEWAPSPPRRSAKASRRGNQPATVVISPGPAHKAEATKVEAEDGDGDEPGTWRRRWWNRDASESGADEDREDDIEHQRTTQFVEADAPRVYRRKRVVPVTPPEEPSRSKLSETVLLPPMVGASTTDVPLMTPPLDPSVLAASLGASGGGTSGEERARELAAVVSATANAAPEPRVASATTERAADGPPIAGSSTPERPAVSSSGSGSVADAQHVVGRPRKRHGGRWLNVVLIVGFFVVTLALVVGLVMTCQSSGAAEGSSVEGEAP